MVLAGGGIPAAAHIGIITKCLPVEISRTNALPGTSAAGALPTAATGCRASAKAGRARLRPGEVPKLLGDAATPEPWTLWWPCRSGCKVAAAPRCRARANAGRARDRPGDVPRPLGDAAAQSCTSIGSIVGRSTAKFEVFGS